MHRYTAPELLSKENQYKCGHCDKLRDAQKRLMISEAPKSLTIQLKRFESSRQRKVTRHVKFGEKLSLTPFLSDECTPPSDYELYGVVVHAGHTCASGHYFAYVKLRNDCWYGMDDTEVTQVNVKTVLAQSAYILFYQQVKSKKIKEIATKAAVELQPVNSTMFWNVTVTMTVAAIQKAVAAPLTQMPMAPAITGMQTQYIEPAMLIPKKRLISDVPVVTQFIDTKHGVAIPQNMHYQTDISEFERAMKSKPSVMAWSHLATSEEVFERNKFVREKEASYKRKRASREDMEYDLPRLKGVTKKMKQQKQQQQFR